MDERCLVHEQVEILHSRQDLLEPSVAGQRRTAAHHQQRALQIVEGRPWCGRTSSSLQATWRRMCWEDVRSGAAHVRAGGDKSQLSEEGTRSESADKDLIVSPATLDHAHEATPNKVHGIAYATFEDDALIGQDEVCAQLLCKRCDHT